MLTWKKHLLLSAGMAEGRSRKKGVTLSPVSHVKRKLDKKLCGLISVDFVLPKGVLEVT